MSYALESTRGLVRWGNERRPARAAGCTAAPATDGDEVLGALTAAAAEGAPFEAILMDFYMVRGAVATAGVRFDASVRRVRVCAAHRSA